MKSTLVRYAMHLLLLSMAFCLLLRAPLPAVHAAPLRQTPDATLRVINDLIRVNYPTRKVWPSS